MFSAWARQLAFLILFVSVIEMLLPAGELRRYVKMVLGLVVLVAVINPLLESLRGKDWVDALVFPVSAQVETDGTLIATGMNLTRTVLADAAQDVQAKSEAQIAALLLAIDGVDDASVDLSSGSPRITLVTADKNPALQERVQRVVAGFIGVDTTQVSVETQTGSAGQGGRKH